MLLCSSNHLSTLGFVQDLLSASMDKTARLWRVGCDSCLKVFFHNNYGKPFPHELMYFKTCRSSPYDADINFVIYYAVTCVQFHPTSDNYFISGCIDGLVRIWDVRKCLVVDWANSKEIITAVCYRPDGKVSLNILVQVCFYQVTIC